MIEAIENIQGLIDRINQLVLIIEGESYKATLQEYLDYLKSEKAAIKSGDRSIDDSLIELLNTMSRRVASIELKYATL